MPDEYLEQTALLGDEQRIRGRWEAWTPPPGVTGLIVDAPGAEPSCRLIGRTLRDGS